MPKVVAEYKAEARERILAAARTVFRRKGFRAATMEDIAGEIGVSKGALYLYFRTKSQLLGAIQEESRRRVLAGWERLVERGDVAEGIAASLDEVFSGDIDPGIWHELVAEAATDPEIRHVMEIDRGEDVKAMTDYLRRLEERGRIRRLRDRATVAEIILALLHGSVVDLMLHGRAAESRRMLVRSLRFLLDKDRR